MFCGSCGKEISKDDVFCVYCGEENRNTQQETSTARSNNSQNTFKVLKEENIASTIQGKIGSQVNKAQSGIDKFKSKGEISREKNRLSNLIQDAQSKKVKILADLGLATYEKMRLGYIDDQELKEISQSILGFDYIIYENSTKIENLDKLSQTMQCECGESISNESKFCSGCGNKIEIPVDNRVFVNCIHCEATIEQSSVFCGCCGNLL